MLNFGGMLLIIGGFMLALSVVGYIFECIEENKRLNKKIIKLERELHNHGIRVKAS